MKEELEVISNPYISSFVRSSGYKTISKEIHATDPMLDVFVFKSYDTLATHEVMRKDFFRFVEREHGGVILGERDTNACVDYDLFCYGTRDDISHWVMSRAEKDLMKNIDD